MHLIRIRHRAARLKGLLLPQRFLHGDSPAEPYFNTVVNLGSRGGGDAVGGTVCFLHGLGSVGGGVGPARHRIGGRGRGAGGMSR
jgi:hypothetical protein